MQHIVGSNEKKLPMDYSECSHSLSHNHSDILIVEDEATEISVFLIHSGLNTLYGYNFSILGKKGNISL